MDRHSEEQGFWDAILEDWDDDGVRLIYADWLAERGRDARANLIRAQCEPGPTLSPPSADMLTLASDVETEIKDHGRVEFRRGFIHRLGVRVPWLLQQADQLEELGPICEVDLWQQHREVLVQRPDEASKGPGYGGPEDYTRLAQCPALRNWRALEIGNSPVEILDPRCLLALVRSPNLHNLRSLRVWSHVPVGDAGVVELAGQPALARLEELVLYYLYGPDSWHEGAPTSRVGPQDVSDAGARALAGSPYLTRLKKLTFHANRLTDQGTAGLLLSRNMAEVRSLTLFAHAMGPLTIDALTRSPHLGRLEELDFSGSNHLYTDDQMQQLVAWPGLARLTQLVLGGAIDDVGLRLFAGCPSIANLKRLSLWGNRTISTEGVSALLASPHLGRLERLDLSAVPVGDPGAEVLATSQTYSGMRSLHLHSYDGARISPENLLALRQRFGNVLHCVEAPARPGANADRPS
jgi:uncharacterized protein (TIGR02996 family)